MEYVTPTVVRIRRKDNKVVQDCDVYIGRRMTQGGWNLPNSIWANPYQVKDYGLNEAIRLYEEHLRALIAKNPATWKMRILELSGKSLGCWCKDKTTSPCHGDIIVKIFSELVLDTQNNN